MRICPLFAVALAVFAAGCDYQTSLSDSPAAAFDPRLAGLWEQPDTQPGQEPHRLLVLPLGPDELLVSYPAGSPDAMFARGWVCRAEEPPLIQLRWFGTARGQLPEAGKKRLFQFFRYRVEGDRLVCLALNPEVVDRDAATAVALLGALEANRDHPELFRQPLAFTRAQAPAQPGGGDATPRRPPVPPAWQ